MTDDFKRRKKATAELAICSVLLKDVYSDIKIKKPSDAECCGLTDISSAPVKKLAEYVLHASKQVLGQHREHRLDPSDQMCS